MEAMVVVERKGNKDHLPGKESQRKKVHMVSLVKNWCCCRPLMLMKFHACKSATSLFRKVHFRCAHESREVRLKNFYSREQCFLVHVFTGYEWTEACINLSEEERGCVFKWWAKLTFSVSSKRSTTRIAQSNSFINEENKERKIAFLVLTKGKLKKWMKSREGIGAGRVTLFSSRSFTPMLQTRLPPGQVTKSLVLITWNSIC